MYKAEYIYVKATQIWVPDLYVINSADANGFITPTDSVLALVHYDGNVILNHALNGY